MVDGMGAWSMLDQVRLWEIPIHETDMIVFTLASSVFSFFFSEAQVFSGCTPRYLKT